MNIRGKFMYISAIFEIILTMEGINPKTGNTVQFRYISGKVQFGIQQGNSGIYPGKTIQEYKRNSDIYKLYMRLSSPWRESPQKLAIQVRYTQGKVPLGI